MFLGPNGRMVPESRRYQDASRVLRLFRGKWHEIINDGKVKGKITPKRLVDLVPRHEFEALAANYTDPVTLSPRSKVFRAWELANRLGSVRGIRGHTVRITLRVQDGKRIRLVSFFRKVKPKGDFSYGFFKQMNNAIGMEGGYLYNRIEGKLLRDRIGRKMHLISMDVQKDI